MGLEDADFDIYQGENHPNNSCEGKKSAETSVACLKNDNAEKFYAKKTLSGTENLATNLKSKIFHLERALDNKQDIFLTSVIKVFGISLGTFFALASIIGFNENVIGTRTAVLGCTCGVCIIFLANTLLGQDSRLKQFLKQHLEFAEMNPKASYREIKTELSQNKLELNELKFLDK